MTAARHKRSAPQDGHAVRLDFVSHGRRFQLELERDRDAFRQDDSIADAPHRLSAPQNVIETHDLPYKPNCTYIINCSVSCLTQGRFRNISQPIRVFFLNHV